MPIAKLADVDLYYEVEGETGPWIVFAHGGGDNHLAWWKQVGALRDRYRCVSYDARWHGRSGQGAVLREADETAAADLLGLMDHLKIERADMMGYSMGGRITAYLGQRSPVAVGCGAVAPRRRRRRRGSGGRDVRLHGRTNGF